MSIVLATLNAKFIHSNLALRYLKEYVKDIEDIKIEEFTINQNVLEISAKLYEMNPEILGFSTYIWNIEETLEICERIKLVNPNTKILLGGPEVSFDIENLLNENPYIDYVIYGEGEESFRRFLIEKSPEDISGMAYREKEEVVINPARPLIQNLNKIPSPYEFFNKELYENKIVYYESSRGCPFKCSFCLSSTVKGVRYMELDRVKRDLDNLIEAEVKQVKFVDRTFNANKEFSRSIMSHIIKRNPENMNFHFEVTADLIDKEQLDLLKDVKEGLFQFEIGVQSTNPDTIKAIRRKMDFIKLSKVCTTIKKSRNIHQHLDLIAGLPYEDYISFGLSFDDVFELRPEKIQLGFLKLLKGSNLRKMKKQYEYKLVDKAPYEIMETKWLSFDNIISLKKIEVLVERYYNEEYFKHSTEYLITNNFNSPFSFFEDLMKFWDINNLYDVSHGRDKLYKILLEYFIERSFEDKKTFKELIKYDYLKNNRGNSLSRILKTEENATKINIHKVLKTQELLGAYLPEYTDVPTKKLLQKIRIHEFNINILKLIEDGYEIICENEKTFILFKYQDGVIERCKTYDITEYIEV